MLMILSPAKSQDFENASPVGAFTEPVFGAETAELVQCLRQYDAKGLSQLMSISDKLGQLNFERYEGFVLPSPPLPNRERGVNSKQAMFVFTGDVYKGLDANTLTEEDIQFAQDHLVMLSGLYGLLRPLDLMQPYRLEMKTKLPNPQGKDLYAFWGSQLTDQLNTWLAQQENPVLVNLASNEYAGAVDFKKIQGTVVTVDFKENKNGAFKTIGIHAKRARGLMARHIIRHGLTDIESLKTFSEAGYQFNAELSTTDNMVFTR